MTKAPTYGIIDTEIRKEVDHMFKFILLGIYVLSVAVFAFIEISAMRAGLRHAKRMMKKGYTVKEAIRPTPVAFLRILFIGLTPVVNTVFAVVLLFCYEGFEDDVIQSVNKYLTKEGA